MYRTISLLVLMFLAPAFPMQAQEQETANEGAVPLPNSSEILGNFSNWYRYYYKDFLKQPRGEDFLDRLKENLSTMEIHYNYLNRALDRDLAEEQRTMYRVVQTQQAGAKIVSDILFETGFQTQAEKFLLLQADVVRGTDLEIEAWQLLAKKRSQMTLHDGLSEAERTALVAEAVEAAINHPELLQHPAGGILAGHHSFFRFAAEFYMEQGDINKALEMYEAFFTSGLDYGVFFSPPGTVWDKYVALCTENQCEISEELGPALQAWTESNREDAAYYYFADTATIRAYENSMGEILSANATEFFANQSGSAP